MKFKEGDYVKFDYGSSGYAIELIYKIELGQYSSKFIENSTVDLRISEDAEWNDSSVYLTPTLVEGYMIKEEIKEWLNEET